MSRITCTKPLLCSKNFATNHTTIRMEPTIQSILEAPFRHFGFHVPRPVSWASGQVSCFLSRTQSLADRSEKHLRQLKVCQTRKAPQPLCATRATLHGSRPSRAIHRLSKESSRRVPTAPGQTFDRRPSRHPALHRNSHRRMRLVRHRFLRQLPTRSCRQLH